MIITRQYRTLIYYISTCFDKQVTFFLFLFLEQCGTTSSSTSPLPPLLYSFALLCLPRTTSGLFWTLHVTHDSRILMHDYDLWAVPGPLSSTPLYCYSPLFVSCYIYIYIARRRAPRHTLGYLFLAPGVGRKQALWNERNNPAD